MKHTKRRWGGLVTMACLAAAVASGSVLAAPVAAQPQLWLAVMEPIWRQILHWPPSDFGQLTKEELWPQVLDRISVFQFTEKYAAHGDLREISKLVNLLQKHGVKIALQGIPLVATTKCGLGVEGFGTKDETWQAGERLQGAGARIDYIVFDEPLFFGHFFRGGRRTKGCRLSIDVALHQVVEREALLRGKFPGLEVGDVEPFGLTDVDAKDWNVAYASWLDGYATLAGHPWDLVQIDAVWSRPQWKDQFLGSALLIKQRKIPYGIFYTGSPSDRSDAEWAATIREDISIFEKNMRMQPQYAVIASWTDFPRRMLPESDPTSMTGVAFDYLRSINKKARH